MKQQQPEILSQTKLQNKEASKTQTKQATQQQSNGQNNPGPKKTDKDNYDNFIQLVHNVEIEDEQQLKTIRNRLSGFSYLFAGMLCKDKTEERKKNTCQKIQYIIEHFQLEKKMKQIYKAFLSDVNKYEKEQEKEKLKNQTKLQVVRQVTNYQQASRRRKSKKTFAKSAAANVAQTASRNYTVPQNWQIGSALASVLAVSSRALFQLFANTKMTKPPHKDERIQLCQKDHNYNKDKKQSTQADAEQEQKFLTKINLDQNDLHLD